MNPTGTLTQNLNLLASLTKVLRIHNKNIYKMTAILISLPPSPALMFQVILI